MQILGALDDTAAIEVYRLPLPGLEGVQRRVDAALRLPQDLLARWVAARAPHLDLCGDCAIHKLDTVGNMQSSGMSGQFHRRRGRRLRGGGGVARFQISLDDSAPDTKSLRVKRVRETCT